MRHDQTDPGQNSVPSRTDGWNPELADAARIDAEADAARIDAEADAARIDAEVRERDRERSPGAAYPADRGAAGSWQDIKSRFVDDPAGAVADAEGLIRKAVDRRIRALHDEVEAICVRQQDEDDASTETLRTRLLRYQQYCERLAGSAVH
jgi:hypothetical protein